MKASRTTRASIGVLAIALAAACGTRVSLGDLDVGEESSGDDAATIPPGAGLEAGSGSDATSSDAGAEAGRSDASRPTYDPCAEKACGDSCKLCDPLVPGCFEPSVIRACSSTGDCVVAPTTCP